MPNTAKQPEKQTDMTVFDLPENLPDQTKFTKKYIPIETIIDLANRNLTSSQIGKILDCDASNIRHRLAGHIGILNHSENFRKNRSNVLTFHQQKILSAFTDADLAIANARDAKDLSIAFRNLYEAERLEEGKSTQNIAVNAISADLEKIDREIAELQARLDVNADSIQGIEQTTQVIDITDSQSQGNE